MKTIDVYQAYNILLNAKLSKVEDVKSKCAIVAILSAFRAIQESHEKDIKTVDKSAQGENHEAFAEKSQNFNALPEAEKIAVNKYFVAYSQRREEIIRQFAEKDVKIKFDKIDKKVFELLLESNPEFSVGQIDILMRTVVK